MPPVASTRSRRYLPRTSPSFAGGGNARDGSSSTRGWFMAGLSKASRARSAGAGAAVSSELARLQGRAASPARVVREAAEPAAAAARGTGAVDVTLVAHV